MPKATAREHALLEEEDDARRLDAEADPGRSGWNPAAVIRGRLHPRARLLEGPPGDGAGDRIGLGRSVYGGVIDENLIGTAPATTGTPGCGESNLLVLPAHFKAERQLPQCALGADPSITMRRAQLYSDVRGHYPSVRRGRRRGVLVQSLTEGQRSAIGGIRAAIETKRPFRRWPRAAASSSSK